MRLSTKNALTLLTIGALVSSCGAREPEPSAAEDVVYYDATGTVVQVLEDHVRIDHDEIPDFMDAMTMSFEVKDQVLVQDLEPGMDVRFRVAVLDREVYIDQIEHDERTRK